MKLSASAFAPLVAMAAILQPTPGLTDPWVEASEDGDRRTVIDLGTMGPDGDGSVRVNLMVFPRDWSPRNSSYEAWIARYDCANATRTVTAIRRYSPDHDPVLETSSKVDRGPAMRQQLMIVCEPASRANLQQFLGLGEVNNWLNR